MIRIVRIGEIVGLATTCFLLTIACIQQATGTTTTSAPPPKVTTETRESRSVPSAETTVAVPTVWQYERPTPTSTSFAKSRSSTPSRAKVVPLATDQYPDQFLIEMAWEIVKHNGRSIVHPPEMLAQSTWIVYGILETGMDPATDRNLLELSWNMVKHNARSVRESPEELARSTWAVYQTLHENFGSQP